MPVHCANKGACRCARVMRQRSPLPCFRCAARRNARGFVALRNAIAPNWAESDYFAPSNAIVHELIIFRTPICGFSRDGGKSSLNRGVFALCLQFEYLQCNARRWTSKPKARPSRICICAIRNFAHLPKSSRQPLPYPALVRFQQYPSHPG